MRVHGSRLQYLATVTIILKYSPDGWNGQGNMWCLCMHSLKKAQPNRSVLPGGRSWPLATKSQKKPFQCPLLLQEQSNKLASIYSAFLDTARTTYEKPQYCWRRQRWETYKIPISRRLRTVRTSKAWAGVYVAISQDSWCIGRTLQTKKSTLWEPHYISLERLCWGCIKPKVAI